MRILNRIYLSMPHEEQSVFIDELKELANSMVSPKCKLSMSEMLNNKLRRLSTLRAS